MRKVLPLVFALLLVTKPVLAWDWGGDSNCPYSENKVNQEKIEQVEESDK